MCKVLQLEMVAILLHRFALAARVQWSGEPSCQGRMRRPARLLSVNRGVTVQVDDAVVGLNSDLPFMRGQCVGARGVGATIFRGE